MYRYSVIAWNIIDGDTVDEVELSIVAASEEEAKDQAGIITPREWAKVVGAENYPLIGISEADGGEAGESEASGGDGSS